MNRLLLVGALALPAFPARAFAAAAEAPAESPVLATVNGVPIRQSDVAARAYQQYGTAVLNAIADDILVGQAVDAQKVKPDAKEINSRLKRIQDQFPDEKTFKEKLTASGSSLEALRAQIQEQVRREDLVVSAKKLALTDSEVKDFFEANKDKLSTPEAVRLRHILVASDKEAGDFLVAIRAGADFGRLASQVSLDAASKDKGGDLGFISKGMLQADMEKVIFALKPGEVSGIVQSTMGFHLFKLEELRSPKPAVFKEVQKDLKAALLADRINKAWPVYLQELRQSGQIKPAQ